MLHEITHITTTDEQELWDLICGDDYEHCLDLTPPQEAESSSECLGAAGITMSDEAFEAFEAFMEAWREELA